MQASLKVHQTATTELMRTHMTQLTEMVKQSEQTLRGEMGDMRAEFRKEFDALKLRDGTGSDAGSQALRRCRGVQATTPGPKERAR